jgi:hypothetical protein
MTIKDASAPVILMPMGQSLAMTNGPPWRTAVTFSTYGPLCKHSRS